MKKRKIEKEKLEQTEISAIKAKRKKGNKQKIRIKNRTIKTKA